ncbi:hypothetical protein QP157_10625 [Sphingomonas sp. LR61]|uniref:hypothetical protein n=1 Tax=Sphingomonas sp. LR61 TaxID=3050234 RepID=UPI002FE1A1F2
MSGARGRQLLPGQTSRVHVYDLESRTSRLVFESSSLLVEAPNVLDDGTLVLNGNGDLWLLPRPDGGTVLDETALVPVPMPGVPEINNDHVLDPSGKSVVVSGRDGDLYRVPVPAGERPRPSPTSPPRCRSSGSSTCTASPRTGRPSRRSSGSAPRRASGPPTSHSSTRPPANRRS